MNPTEQNKSIYNRIAPHFSSTRSFVWKDLQTPVFTQFVKSGDMILDIGCGNGRLYTLFADLKVSYTGIDQSEALIAIAKERFPKATFLVEEMSCLSFADTTFDVVYCIAAFHHLTEPKTQVQALQEMKRILKPTGKIIMLNWNLFGEWGKKKLEAGEIRQAENNEQVFFVPWKTGAGESLGERVYYGFHVEELEALVKEAGLVMEDQWFTRQGRRTAADKGENIVSVMRREDVGRGS